MAKSADAFRTISEVADWLEVPAHVLRFWESKFTQVKPVKRAGGRRYYRPTDMKILGGIKVLLHDEGLTIKGVQKLLREHGVQHVAALSPAFEGEDGARVLNFARPEEPPDAPRPQAEPDTAPTDDEKAPDTPEPEAAAEPEPDPAPDPGPDAAEPEPTSRAEAAPDPEAEPAAMSTPDTSAAASATAAPSLPPLPDLPPDPPDDAPAAPGPLARLATLPRPLSPALAGTLSALAARLRDGDAPKP